MPELTLPPGEVHLWLARLDSLAPQPELLDPEERERAARFLREQDRRRFTVARGVLRSLLARYLPPGTIRFETGQWGKPRVSGLRFNLSHSSGLALYGFALDREIGVDIERVRDVPEMLRIAERFFQPGEVESLRARPEPAEFFRIWTRTEAWLKGTGRGITALACAPEPPWFIAPVEVDEGYAAAVGVECEPARITLRAAP